MTTPAAERLYLAQHQAEWEGKRYAIYNPQGRPFEELPVIFGFNNGGNPGWYSGRLLAEDGTGLGSHICSHEGYMLADLGILDGSRPDRHEGFRKHYPDGYRMEFVGLDEVKNRTNERFEDAVKRAEATRRSTSDEHHTG